MSFLRYVEIVSNHGASAPGLGSDMSASPSWSVNDELGALVNVSVESTKRLKDDPII